MQLKLVVMVEREGKVVVISLGKNTTYLYGPSTVTVIVQKTAHQYYRNNMLYYRFLPLQQY